ncbi:unnamed protein product [Lota lota]
MDSTQDVSARVLLTNIIYTEPPRTPVTRSRKRPSGTGQTPREVLKMHLKRKLHKSASGSSLAPDSKRLSGLHRPGLMTSLMDDDDITPRRLLQNIIHTGETTVLLTQSRPQHSPNPEPSANLEQTTALTQTTTHIDLDLPDVTLATTASTVKRLRRTRPRTSFNVTAFEKNMEAGQGQLPEPDQGELPEPGQGQLPEPDQGHELLSLSTSLGSASLSLNTPSVDVSTGRVGLRRKTQRQTKFSADDFNAAVQQRQLAEGEDGDHLTLHGTSSVESFTLGDRDLPNISADIIHQCTTLYDTCQLQGGPEQRAGDVEDHLSTKDHHSTEVQRSTVDQQSTEDHPLTEDHPPSEDHPSTEEHELITHSTTEVEPVAMETEEEDGAETNVEEEEQGKPVAMETQNQVEAEGVQEEVLGEGEGEEEGVLEEVLEEEDGKGEVQGDRKEEIQGVEEVEEEEGGQSDEEVQGDGKEEVQGEEEGLQAEELQEEEEVLEDGVQEEEDGVQEEEEDGVQEEEEDGVQEEEEDGQEEEEEDGQEEEKDGQEEDGQEEEFHEGPTDQEELEEELSGELSMKTPAFVRMKKIFVLGEGSVAPQQGLLDTRETPARPRKVRAKRVGAAGRTAHLSKSYLMSTFKHFAKTRVAMDVYPVLDNIVEAFFDRMALDLETYAHHAKRKTIEVADVELLLRRQGYVNDKVPVAVLIEKYLPMEYRKMLIPVATSGNIVIPKPK